MNSSASLFFFLFTTLVASISFYGSDIVLRRRSRSFFLFNFINEFQWYVPDTETKKMASLPARAFLLFTELGRRPSKNRRLVNVLHKRTHTHTHTLKKNETEKRKKKWAAFGHFQGRQVHQPGGPTTCVQVGFTRFGLKKTICQVLPPLT